MIFGRRGRVVVDVVSMAAGIGAVLLVVFLAFAWGGVEWFRSVEPREEFLIVAASAIVLGALAGTIAWLDDRFSPARRLEARTDAERTRTWREFVRLSDGTDQDAVAAISAPLAVAAWDDETPARWAVLIAAYLAGNEAETHLFGLDRLAYCCRADGSVPIAPAERLAAAEALALRGATLARLVPFSAAALALVRLAQGRHDGAAELLRPHLQGGPDLLRAQVRALFAVALLRDDPDAALRQARAVWENLSTKDRRTPAADTVRHALAHVERHAART